VLLLLLQRATIVVHDGKILVKTEIVKAIITADKAVLIKGRCGLAKSTKTGSRTSRQHAAYALLLVDQGDTRYDAV
jgi:hypothetical protein